MAGKYAKKRHVSMYPFLFIAAILFLAIIWFCRPNPIQEQEAEILTFLTNALHYTEEQKHAAESCGDLGLQINVALADCVTITLLEETENTAKLEIIAPDLKKMLLTLEASSDSLNEYESSILRMLQAGIYEKVTQQLEIPLTIVNNKKEPAITIDGIQQFFGDRKSVV